MPGTTGLTTYDLESNVNGGAFELAAEVVNALWMGSSYPAVKKTQSNLSSHNLVAACK